MFKFKKITFLVILFSGIFFSNFKIYAQEIQENLIKNGGFEEALNIGWGSDPYDRNKTIWWNHNNCQSKVDLDKNIKKNGIASLHIVNPSGLAAEVYGTMAQNIPIKKDQLYKITIWAKANNLASGYTIGIIADKEWKVYPITLPKATFGWKKFEGTFKLLSDQAEIRIITRDKGEVWIDDISVIPLIDELY